MTKVFVMGVDGAFPEYFFGEWMKELPNIRNLIENSSYAKLNSTTPPLSITAWTSIVTGKTPTDTGLFEYIYRKNHSYTDIGVTTAINLKEKNIWQIASDHNKRSTVTYMMLTWPIKPFNGYLVSGSRTPSGENVKSVYPDELGEELKKNIGEVYSSGSPHFRKLNTKEEVIEDMYKLTTRHFEVMEYLLKKKNWDLFFGMVIASDKMNHSFWRYMDKGHRKYEPNSKYENVLKEYYKFVDKRLGDMFKLLDKDTKIIVLSDHGIMRMHSRVNLTDWLIQNKYMFLKEPIKEKTEFNFNMVDWNRTKAFAIGAYEGQIFLNMKGREPEGIIEDKDCDFLIEELIQKLSKITGDDGSKLETLFFKKKEHFKGKFEKEAPDLMVYFDDLQYGCNTTMIGNETLWSPQTAKGSDDAGHSKQGIFIMKDGNHKNKNLGEISYLDVAPTILNLMEVPIPKDMKGKILF